jgi:YD repeat-containing protein
VNALWIVVLGAGACTNDTGTQPDPAVCRNYSSNFTETSTNTQNGMTAMRTYTCAFSTATNALTCTSSRNGVGCETNTKQYASTADFVDEVSVIPPRSLFQTETWTNISTCGANPNRTDTYSYDAQRRVTSGTNGLTSVTYTAWDAAGRPTAATFSTGSNASWTYDASTRTRVQTVTGATSATLTSVYDTNGNLTNTTATANGIAVSFSGSVAAVCK